METLLQDLRFGIRNLGKSKGVALVAIITLALGIGANTAIFSVIHAVLLQPLPFRDPGQLVRLYQTEAAPGQYPITGADYLDWKKDNKTFADLSFFHWPHNMNLSGSGEAQQVIGVPTEANFFSVLGVQPLLGRTWVAGEDQPGKGQVAILSYGLWRTMFHSDAAVIGKTIELDAAKYTIVGVMQPTFQFPVEAQLWIPQDMSAKGVGPRGNHGPGAIGRLKPGVTVQQGQADLSVISARLEQQFPETNYKVGAIVLPLHDTLVGKSRASLFMMLGAVVLVLLIACVNVANLLLSRAVAREREMAVRSALGASRMRLVRQLLTESVLLGLLGGVAGLALAAAGIKFLVSLKSLAIPPTNPVQMNTAVLLFTLGVAVLAGILFGLVPALQISRPGLFDELKGGAGNTATASQQKRFTSNLLVIAEVGFSLLLLISAGLLLKDFKAMRDTNIGVRTDHIWTAALRLPPARYAKQPQQFHFAQALLEKVQQLPGVETASISDRLPLFGGSNGYIHLPGHETEPMGGPLVESHNVSPDYFHAFNIPVLQGNAFQQEDLENEIRIDEQQTKITDAGGEVTAEQGRNMIYNSVINQTMANQFWPGQSPVGQLYTTGDEKGPWHRVVGVVGDVKQWGLSQPVQPESYDVWDGQAQFYFVIHTSVDPASITGAVRQAVAGSDSGLPLYRIRTMQDLIADNSAGAQFITTLLGVFAGLALMLAVVGIYGVLSYQVTQRTREIGIRMSLGATPANVVRLVLMQGLRLAFWGFAIGVISAYATRRLISSSLQMIKADDPAIFFATPVLLLLVAMVACSVPALRASRINPMVALRQD